MVEKEASTGIAKVLVAMEQWGATRGIAQWITWDKGE